VYLRLVEAYRDDQGKVRHRVLRTLGREDQLKASGQLEQLAGLFARLMLPSACLDGVGTPEPRFRGSIAQPAQPLPTLRRRPREQPTHGSGPPWIANPSM
jgi:hypothetical protein